MIRAVRARRIVATLGLAVLAVVGCRDDAREPLGLEEGTDAIPAPAFQHSGNDVCTTIDFDGFQDGDRIGGGPGEGIPPGAHDIVVPAAELGLPSDLVLRVSTAGNPGPPAQGSRNQARIFDTSKDPAGWEDQDLLVNGAAPLGPCADCAGLGNILVIEDGRGFFRMTASGRLGDSPAGGDITITGFPAGFDFFLRSYVAVDNEDVERPIVAIGDGTELGRTTGRGNASVETVVTDHTTFNRTLLFDYMNASGGVDDIVLCRLEDRPPCRECEGGVSAATFRYLGTSAAQIVVLQKARSNLANAKPEEKVFEGLVQPGGTLSVAGTGKDGKFLSNDLTIFVDGVVAVPKIHVSCSQPFAPGLIFGGLFEVVSATSVKGGEICPLPPPPVCQECKGGVVSLALKLLGTGTNAVQVRVQAGSAVVFSGAVVPGNTFTFSGNRSDGRFSQNNLDIFVGGQRVGSLHVSCSDVIGPGTTDESQGKGRARFSNAQADVEVVEAISKDGGVVCPVPPPPPPGTASSCADGKPAALEFEYTGKSCAAAAGLNAQGSKSTCTGSLNGSQPVRIVVNSASTPASGNIFFNSNAANIDVGETFTASTANAGVNKFSSDSWAHVFTNGTKVQTIKFHTSCSQPLAVGDEFGSLRLVGFIPRP